MTAEKKYVLYAVLASVVVMAAAAIYAPQQNEDDPSPSVTNPGALGAKAAFVLLGRLGYRAVLRERPLASLGDLDPAHTTLVLADPWGDSQKPEQDALAAFLRQGGRVLATGVYGEQILPGYFWNEDPPKSDKCRTAPQGTSTLAEPGPLDFEITTLAKQNIAEIEVAQTCPDGAAVIWYAYGKGTVVWWAGPAPLTNRGLHEDANLKLLLASLGPENRTVVFNEWEQGGPPPTAWSQTKGLPIAAMVLQLLLAGVFLVLTFGRRHGPVRDLASTPRTSPLEFAHSMGNLYFRAGRGEAAVAEARQRLVRVLERQCGLSREVLAGSADEIAAELQDRFQFSDPRLVPALSLFGQRIPPREALTLVQTLYDLTASLGRLTEGRQARTTLEKTLA